MVVVQSQFAKGSISRVKLRDFLTYNEVEFRPGPRLNIVMGPNGTGKSSIVCAIAIGLGASPKVLGRADTLTEFVRTGCEEATTEIDLVGEGGDSTTVRRIISKSSRGTSKWKINGRSATEPEVRRLVENEFNIQIANLCTFLPQEKVGEFSAFDDVDLLRETEKAVGGTELLDQHDALISAQREMREASRREEGLREKLEELRDRKRSLEPERDRLERREAHLEIAALCAKRLIWMDFEDAKDAAAVARDEEREKRKEYSEASTRLEPLREKVKLAADAVNRCQKSFTSRSKDLMGGVAKAEKCAEDVEKLSQSIENARASYDNVSSRGKKTREKLKKAIETHAQKQSELAAFCEDVDGAIAARKDELKELKPAVAAAQTTLDEASDAFAGAKDAFLPAERQLKAAKKELALLDDRSAQRVLQFARLNTTARDACRLRSWIDDHAGSFVKPVLGPVGLELDCDPSFASVFESHVAHWIWTSFVCQTKADYDSLHKAARDLRLTSPGLHVSVAPQRQKPRKVSEEAMERHLKPAGILGYLDELIPNAHPAVLDVLCSQSQIHTAMYGAAKDVDKNIAEIERACDGGYVIIAFKQNQLWRYSGVQSRYGQRKVSTSVNSVTGKGYLAASSGGGGDTTSRDEVSQRVERASKEVERLREAYDAESSRLDEAKRALASRKESVSAVTRWINKVKKANESVILSANKIEKLEREIENVKEADEADRKRASKQVEDSLSQLVEKFAEQARLQKQVIFSTVRTASPVIGKDVAKTKKAEAEGAVKDKEKDIESLKQQAERAKKEFASLKTTALELKKKAQQEAPDCDFEPIADLEDRDAVVQKQKFEENEARQIHQNPGLLDRYNSICQELIDHEKRTESMATDQAHKQTQIDALRAPWENTLRGALDDLKKKFEDYMSTLKGARGSVEIKTADSYDRWGLRIQVAFRDGSELRKLEAHVQSGGERSVSTIMFLMALQAHMPSPFRVVDEINQGMDEVNERIVFKRVVLNSTGPDAPQYFLITPKLLPRLRDMDHPDVRALVVFNGAFSLKRPQDWDLPKFIEQKKRKNNEQQAVAAS